MKQASVVKFRQITGFKEMPITMTCIECKQEKIIYEFEPYLDFKQLPFAYYAKCRECSYKK